MEIIDISFDKGESTADRLVKATQALIAAYGYDTTTTRMIANLSQVNLSAINFHFGSKENLVKAAVQKAADDLEKTYSRMACDIRRFLKKQPVDKEEAWGYLDRFLTNRIRSAFDYRASWINIGLVEHENGLPESSKGILARTVVRTSEQVLAELILAVGDKKDVFQAALIARAIMAAIMSYTEKPLMNQYLEECMGVALHDSVKVQEGLHKHFMESIRAAVTVEASAIKY